MVLKRYQIIGYVFDVIAAIISILDLSTDVWIIITWYQQERMTFFWISFVILLLAQMAHITVFYFNHGKEITDTRDFLHSVISILFTVPFAPMLSFIFYLVAEDGSFLRRVIDKLPMYNFDWHKLEIDTDSSKFDQYLETKVYKHAGFITEAFIEAFPQSILQLTAIVYFDEPDTLSIVSILISMTSVCGKLFLWFVDSGSWKHIFHIWITFVLDFFGIFFIVSFAFYTPSNPEYTLYFNRIQSILFYDFIICIFPNVIIGTFGICLYWSIRTKESGSALMRFCFTIGLILFYPIGVLFACMAAQVLCAFWVLVYISWMSTDNRIPDENVHSLDKKKANLERSFYRDAIRWVSNENNVNYKIAGICAFNTVMIQEWDEKRVGSYNKTTFLPYLQQQATTEYKNVTFREIRNNAKDPDFSYKIGEEHRFRNPSFLMAFWYEFILDLYGASRIDWKKDHQAEDFVAMITTFVGAYCGLPLYTLSRIFHLVLPLFVLVYLYIDGDIILFIDIPIFQIIMWSVHLLLIMIWIILLYLDSREEYYSWHILPNIRRFGNESREWMSYEEYDRLCQLISDHLYSSVVKPFLNRDLTEKFGQDVCLMILDLMEQFDDSAVVVEDLLTDTFNAKISGIIADYYLE